jgi:hypothetical protein
LFSPQLKKSFKSAKQNLMGQPHLDLPSTKTTFSFSFGGEYKKDKRWLGKPWNFVMGLVN